MLESIRTYTDHLKDPNKQKQFAYKATKVTAIVGYYAERIATLAAGVLGLFAVVIGLDDLLIYKTTDWAGFENCARGGQSDYNASGWYQGFGQRTVRICPTEDVNQCFTCTHTDTIFPGGLPTDRFMYCAFVVIPTAVGIFLTGKGIKYLANKAEQYNKLLEPSLQEEGPRKPLPVLPPAAQS